jgi:hypothetical protein
MQYIITRDGQEYGPYTLADLQRYVATGHILATDLAKSEGMSEALPVSQIIGTMPVPQPLPPSAPAAIDPGNPDSPNLHWGLVLLFSILSCGMFSAVWNLVQAAWMKRVAPQSRALYYYIVGICALAGIFAVSFYSGATHTRNTNGSVLNLVYGIITLVGRFSLRSSLEDYFTNVEPFGLTLSGVMTFFFGDIYFQYHLNDIMRRKHAMRLGSMPV